MARFKPPRRAAPVRRALTELEKFREKALIDAGVRKSDIAAVAEARFGYVRQSIGAVIRSVYRSVDRLEPLIAEMTFKAAATMAPECTTVAQWQERLFPRTDEDDDDAPVRAAAGG